MLSATALLNGLLTHCNSLLESIFSLSLFSLGGFYRRNIWWVYFIFNSQAAKADSGSVLGGCGWLL